jgi:hypothetical protein
MQGAESARSKSQFAPWGGLLLLAMGLFCVSLDAISGKIYKWVDESGKVHYGAHAPPSSESTQEMEIRLPQDTPEDSPSDEQKQQRLEKRLQVYEEIRQEKRERQAQEREERKRKAQQCGRLRLELNDYQEGGLLYRLDDQGNRHFLTDAEIAREIDQLQDLIARNCR